MSKRHGANLEFVREDDFVEYFIFPSVNDNVANDEEQLRNYLSEVRNDCIAFVQQKVTERSYIWHKDEFQLQPRTGSAQERLLNDEGKDHDQDGDVLPSHLHGVTHYGDNIGDEWFIVFLLSELTRSRPEFIARVCDADGEFLLIEAADALPDWADPETCEQRVYLVNGGLQLVQNSPSNTNNKRMTIASAVQRIRLNPTLYRCSRDIMKCIDERLQEFQPPQPHASIHRQVVQLPQNAAMLLKQRPSLIAAAVRAFCERDTLDAKALRAMRYFPPESPRVRMNVRFTRCLYAMIMHSQYTPERKLGWKLTDTNTESYKEQLLGVKIASGLEILAAQAKRADENLEQSPAWRAYLRTLNTKGYFRENIEGSAEHSRLLAVAQQYYKSNQERFRTAPLVGAEILDLLLNASNSENSEEQTRDGENNLQPSDPDDWLNISADDLDAMLQQRYGPKKLFNPSGDMDAAQFTKHLTDFLDQQSNFEGIEPVEEDLDSDDDPTPSSSTTSHRNPAQQKKEFGVKVKKNNSMRRACQRNSLLSEDLEQEQQQDSTHVRNFLDFVIPEDNWDSTSEMSDYADEDDLEHNMNEMPSSDDFALDRNIKAYMEQMDRELAQTTIGKSFHGKSKARMAEEDDFDDIEDFEPININVNTLKNLMDSYKSQVGGAGPVSNLFNAMGVGMSAAAADEEKSKDLSESAV